MKRALVYISFIPWFLYFIKLCLESIKDFKNVRSLKTWLKENYKKMFVPENITLFLVYVFFATIYRNSDQIFITRALLFLVINIYLFLNKIYEKKKTEERLSSYDIPIILIIVLLSVLPIWFYSITHQALFTHLIMFVYIFLNQCFVYLAKLMVSLINKIIKVKNEN